MKKKQLIFLFLISVGAMLFCTKSSPLYPFNDWGDANIYFTMGKGMLEGKVPYRDLYDHKGPLIYAIYAIAGMISKKSFLGVWILEIIAATVFSIYSYKTLCLFCKKNVIILMPVYVAVVYAANHMRHGGSAEELCLTFLAYGLYVLAKYLVQKKMFKDIELLLIGITSGFVLWIKYTMLGFYMGWIIVPAVLMLRNKEWKVLVRSILIIAAGVILSTIPIFAYFIANGAFADLITVYFYNNIFVYAGEKVSLVAMILRILENVLKVAAKNIFIFAMIAIGMITLFIKKQFKMLSALTLGVICLIATTLTAPTVHGYYSMCFSVFGIFGLWGLWLLCENVKQRYVSVLSIGVMLIHIFMNGYNIEFLFYPKDEMPQYRFAEIIKQSENPTLLNYGFLDSGFYTTANVSPSCKYFFEANINLQEMKDEQKEMIEQGKVEYVVTFDDVYDWPLYENVANTDFLVEGNDVTYHLYKLK